MGEAQQAAARIDGDRLYEVLSTLASDGLAGRFTLSPTDIERAAAFIAEDLKAAGLRPIGDDYRIPFPFQTGVETVGTPSFTVSRGGKTQTLVPEAFAPVGASGSGKVEGEVVFVGYAAQAEARDGRPGYDDLAGLDLKGKVALVLLDSPARPNVRMLWSRLSQEVRQFERQAAGLVDAGDTDALGRLHRQTLERLAALVRPFMRGAPIPDSFFSPPAEPNAARIDLQARMGPVMEVLDALPGPKFEFTEGRLRTKLDRLQEAGAAGVIVIRGPRSFVDEAAREEDALGDGGRGGKSFSIPVVQMRWKVAEQRFRIGKRRLSKVQAAIDSKLEPQSVALTGTRVELDVQLRPIEHQIPNVLAYLPGSDLANEIVIVGAHYDHIGTDVDGRGQCTPRELEDGTKDGICNGADDNASGTATVLEIARVLAAAPEPPRRTVVFALFAGEELGLHGSKALADAPPALPPFEGGKVVAMVNADMIGRLGEAGLAIGGVGSSPAWMGILDEIGDGGMPILYDRAITTRSDHASFYRHEIPVLFFFTQLHDDYHGPGDEADKINREGLAQVAELVHQVVRKAADGRPIAFAKPRVPEEGLVPSLPGTNPETVERRVGLPEVGSSATASAGTSGKSGP